MAQGPPPKTFLISFRKPRAAIPALPDQSLMQALLAGGRPVASSCRGDGVCAKCRIRVVAGRENLTPENDTEKFLRVRHELAPDERISCQTFVRGDVEVDAPYW